MTWGFIFRTRQSVKGSLWVLPLVGAVVGAIAGTIFIGIELLVELPAQWQYSADTASTVIASIVGATVALTGFVVTVSVLVVQMATGTFSARYMRLWYRSRMLKGVLAVLIGTLTFSFALLRNVQEDFVPSLGVWVAGGLMTLDLILFVLFLDHFLHRLRPVAVAVIAARAGRAAFEESVAASHRPDAPTLFFTPVLPAGDPSLVVLALSPGSIQAIDAHGLMHFAQTNDCLVVLPHAIGDFVPSGARLLEVHGPLTSAQPEAQLRGMVALGAERTIEQDPAFALRVMVDIACRALSAAVNDPTTAVQVLDHMGDFLATIGRTDLQAAARPLVVTGGTVALRGRRWEDFLELGVTEIRTYGRLSIQVMRRLRALLEELRETVRPECRAAVDEELRRLDLVVRAQFGETPDFDRAMTADRQGIGGATDLLT